MIILQPQNCYALGSSCERPTPIENADLKPEYDSQIEFDHGAKVEYDCKIGYSIEGTSRARECKNGQWSEILFHCYRKYRQTISFL